MAVIIDDPISEARPWRALIHDDATQEAIERIGLSDENRDAYTYLRVLPDGRLCGVLRLLMHWTLQVDIDWSGYRERYCYATLLQALLGLVDWDGKGDPGHGWHRHPETGRRRDPATGREWLAG